MQQGGNMLYENIQLDVEFVRSQFPAFKDPLCRDWSFFENAGGSYVPQTVINRLNNFMISTKVQPYAEYPMSKIAGEEMDEATELFARMINAKNKEIIIGGSTSNNGSITFAAASGGDWAQATHFGVWNNSAGTSANFMLGGALTSSVTCTEGDAVQF